jgi:soluble lytic murein transglycosylase
MRPVLLALITILLAVSGMARGQDSGSGNSGRTDDVRLLPTRHVAVPATASDFWLVPDTARPAPAAQRLARGAALIVAGEFEKALPLVSAAGLAKTPLAGYASYYRALALLGLNRLAEADAALAAAGSADLHGYLGEALPMRAAEVALSLDDPRRAVALLEELVEQRLFAPEAAWLLLGQAAERAGDVDRALEAYRRVYYDFATSTQAAEAQTGILELQTADRIPPDRYARELERAQRLFDAGRWAQARAGFEPLAKVAQGDDARLIALRLAQCDSNLNRRTQARTALAQLTARGEHRIEARYYHLMATRAVGDHAPYVKLARQLVADEPESPWAAETLHNLASHYITSNQDEAADGVFRELLRLFPKHPHAERAAWKVGWRAYRAGRLREAADTFDRAASMFPRADYRPSWLYWSARARTQLRDTALASERYSIVIGEYQNSYYGRLAAQAVEGQRQLVVRAAARVTATAAPDARTVPTETLIRELIALELYDDALREVRYAQRIWGDSARLQATSAFVRHNQGIGLRAQERFTALRGAINTMRRAYPQFMASGGEDLPVDVLRIIFPLDHWPLITKYASAHKLDPYLLAALMAQESTFTAEIRSSANAIGLMQIIPATGRRLATRLGVRNFSTNALTQPELNVRLGTRYFRDLLDQFGEAHFALASYNAGENRVVRWRIERGPLPADEFIDDIPFAETQNYVKRILGTAEDYRRLYGEGLLDPNVPLSGRGARTVASLEPRRLPEATLTSR